MLSILLLSCAGLGHSAAPSSPAPGPAHRVSALADHAQRVAFRRLRTLTVKARRGDPSLRASQLVSLAGLLQETQALRLSEPEFKPEINLALFEMAALEWAPEALKDADSLQICRELASAGRSQLELLMSSAGDEIYPWMAESILGTDKGPMGIRLVAAELLQGKRVRSTRQALMFTARTSSLELRHAALEALVGWDDPVVDHFFLTSMTPTGGGFQYLARHFSSLNRKLKPRVEEPLLELCKELFRSTAWRDAARARPLIRCISPSKAIPVLLDALMIWDHRKGGKTASKRILWEICRELRQLSGTSMKPDPDLWQRWWQGIESGKFKLPSQISSEGDELSQGGFYGLQPVTDRVWFVIDRSGSMNDPVGTDAGSRYDEAVGRFVDYMQSAGPETSFSVLLFSDDSRVFSRTLVPASSRNIEGARRWLTQNGPGGGTFLQQAVFTALAIGPDGRIPLEELEADTVVVLCDGATAEGPEWVEPWLKRWNDEAQLVFHCVEIGHTGDGTLPELARQSGGDYVLALR